MPLTDKQIRGLKPEGTRKKYFDGGRLYLEVSPKGGKWWRLKSAIVMHPRQSRGLEL